MSRQAATRITTVTNVRYGSKAVIRRLPAECPLYPRKRSFVRGQSNVRFWPISAAALKRLLAALAWLH